MARVCSYGIQAMSGCRVSIIAAAPMAIWTVGRCSWTYQTALPGPNHPGSPFGSVNWTFRKNSSRIDWKDLATAQSKTLRLCGTGATDGGRLNRGGGRVPPRVVWFCGKPARYRVLWPHR